MPGFATCHACDGFVADLAAPCPHCHAPPPRRRALARYLATRLLGVATAVTLMACYGATYDCYDCDPVPCVTDADCAQGAYCEQGNPGFRECVWSGTCSTDDQCPAGQTCDESRSTCVPNENPCTSNADCLIPTERCDFTRGECVPALPCNYDGAACGEGARCDGEWGVCVPCYGLECGECRAEVTCAETPPACPEGTEPAVAGGCYTAACIQTATCDAEWCSALDETACAADPGCEPTYVGINCSNPDGGGPCTPDACVCESYEYGACVPLPPVDPPA